MNFLVVIILLIFLMCMCIGCYKGLVSTFLGALATIVAIFLAYLLTPFVSQLLISQTTIDDKIEMKVYSTIEAEVKEQIEKKQKELLKAAGEKVEGYSLPDSELSKYMSEQLSRSEQVELIDSLSVPSFIRTSLIENNHDEVYSKMKVGDIYSYISKYIAYACTNAIATVLTVVLIKLALTLIIFLISLSVNRIPIVSWVNRAGGLCLGIVTALIISWIVLILAAFLLGDTGRQMIDESAILTYINNKNVFNDFITNITDILFS